MWHTKSCVFWSSPDKCFSAYRCLKLFKDRAKIQSKRRPPSRHSRVISPGADPGPSLPNGLPDVKELPSADGDGPRLPELPPIDNSRVAPPKTDLFGNDDLLGDSTSSPVIANSSKASNAVSNDHLLSNDNNDLFSPKRDKKKSAISDDDLFSTVKSESKSNSKSILTNDDEEDIFGASSVKTNTSKPSKYAVVNGKVDSSVEKGKSSEEKKTVAIDDDEDIFAPKPKTKKATDFEKLFDKDNGVEKSKTDTAEKTKGANMDDDDIFADSSLGKKKGLFLDFLDLVYIEEELLGVVVAEWLSSWLAKQEVRRSIPHIASWISEIGYLLLPLKRRKSSKQPANQEELLICNRIWKSVKSAYFFCDLLVYQYPFNLSSINKYLVLCIIFV